ncbi:ATP-dependent Clp protease ATP-binding subunit [Candidatus Microgenomates bacterium]|nr:ATP-dependent Clp protease ATP-binding subunit [Candidatus Microgenomates bacterium]
MKYLTLPAHLIQFWYIEASNTFIRTWKNLILFLEEDLAVGLMIKLLFVPLFHDATIVGRTLSFLFRIGRILIGLFAFALASILVFLIALYWFLLPLLALLDKPHLISWILFLSGTGLFGLHISLNPHKKVWQVNKDNLWLASKVKRQDLSFKKLLTDPEVGNLLSTLELEVTNFPEWEIADLEKVGFLAFELAKKTGAQYITPRHFFVAALKQIPNIDSMLLKLDLKFSDIEEALNFLEKKREVWRKVWLWDDDFVVRHLKGVNRGWLGVPTPVLDSVGEDLTKKAAKGEFKDFTFIRSNGVVEEIVNILSQKTGKNVIVVALPGAGKSALIRHLAKQIVLGDAPSSVATKRLVLLDLTKLLSGMTTQGLLAERIKTIFEEVEFAQNVIIVIEEIHELGMGEVGKELNLYSLMQPFLESDTFQFIGTTEPENYAKVLERNGSFARIFRKIELPPATREDTLNILQIRSVAFERREKIKVSFLAIKAALELSSKIIHDRVLPDSAISVLKEAQTRPISGWVTSEVVREVVSSRTQIPLMDLGKVDKDKLLKLEERIHERMVNQEQAVKLVSDSLRRSVTGLREEARPIGSFLFVGPTGVGKTELARTLAQVYFKTSGAFLRFDMSEYQNPESVVRLIGSSGEGGQLTEAVRSRPYALLLLDEFEKADPKILTLFLQVLEDGRLTDGAGRTVDFTNTIIIATSNAASITIAKGLEARQTLEQLDKQVNDELLQIFKPELINRFDDVVLFKPLSQEDLQKIVTLKLSELQAQLKEKGYLVEFEGNLISELAKRGFDPVLGARPLRRLIQDTLEAKLSRLILENKLLKGQSFRVDISILS